MGKMSDIKNMKVEEVAKKLTIEKGLDIKLKLTNEEECDALTLLSNKRKEEINKLSPEEKKKLEENEDALEFFPFKNAEERYEYEVELKEKYYDLFEEKLSEIERVFISSGSSEINRTRDEVDLILSECNSDEEEMKNVVENYINYLEDYFHLKELGLADVGECFKDTDNNRKIRFMVYEQTTFGEDSDDNEEEEEEEEEEEQPRELTEHEQELLDEYNRETEHDARDELATIQQRQEERINEIIDNLLRLLRRRHGENVRVSFGSLGLLLIATINEEGEERLVYSRYRGDDIQSVNLSREEGDLILEIERERGRLEPDEVMAMREEREGLEQPQHINTNETFKSKCCVLCLDENTTPTILFCSCGHLCLCEKCDKVYAKKECPVCRVKSEIKRKI